MKPLAMIVMLLLFALGVSYVCTYENKPLPPEDAQGYQLKKIMEEMN